MTTPRESSLPFAITVKDVAHALAFYAQAFGARELYRLDQPKGGVAHAECVISDTCFFISDADAEWPALVMLAGMTAAHLFEISTTNCDGIFARAVQAGAVVLVPPRTQIWGSRHAVVRDPFGYYWTLSQEETAPLPACFKTDEPAALEACMS